MTVSRSIEITSTPEAVWALISDLPQMGRLSPENTGGSWKGGATGPAVGATFKGSNANGKKTWSTNVKITQCEPGSALGFRVSFAGIPVSDWAYAVVAHGATCTVTESWTDRRPGWFKAPAALTTGVKDRNEEWNGKNLEATLAALKALAEKA